jgi:hypothetical protein
VVLSVISCFNPFFPETGTPQQIESSPGRTIQLLKEAYERKDIYSFEDLIYSKNEFSSYTQISDGYLFELNNFLSATIPKVFIDSVFIPNRFLFPNLSYFELKWEDEYRIHRKMFEALEEIVFLSPFYVSDVQYEIRGDDTVSALVKTESSKMRIIYGGNNDVVDITGQIFAMKKHGEVWKIWKWIELN